jgi:REP element-mobilizing transposase RayT
MKYNPDVCHRRSIRRDDILGTSQSACFITICTEGREHLLGEIHEGCMVPSLAGQMAEKVWNSLRYYNVELDCFQIMPNHVHGIVILPESGDDEHKDLTIAGLVHRYKSLTTNRYIHGVKAGLLPQFNKRIWQRNYYEHQIRNNEEFSRIRHYILENPKQWKEDVLFLTEQP